MGAVKQHILSEHEAHRCHLFDGPCPFCKEQAHDPEPEVRDRPAARGVMGDNTDPLRHLVEVEPRIYESHPRRSYVPMRELQDCMARANAANVLAEPDALFKLASEDGPAYEKIRDAVLAIEADAIGIDWDEDRHPDQEEFTRTINGFGATDATD